MMSDYGRCERCGSFGWLPHGCREFECAFDDGNPGWIALWARDMEIAAEKYAEQTDCEGDYTVIQAGENGNFIVMVREPENDSTIKKFHVYGETVPEYHAREVVSP